MKFKHYKSAISEIIKEIEKRKINYLFKSLKEQIN